MSNGAASAFGPGGTPGNSTSTIAAGGGGGAAPTAGAGSVNLILNAKTDPWHVGPYSVQDLNGGYVSNPQKITGIDHPGSTFLENNGFWVNDSLNPGIVYNSIWLWYDLVTPFNGHYIFTFAAWDWGTLFVNGQDWINAYNGAPETNSRYLGAGTHTLYIKAMNQDPTIRIGSLGLTVGYQASSNGGSGGNGYVKIAWE